MTTLNELIKNAQDDSFFSLLIGFCQGAVVVDVQARICWISDSYCTLLGINNSKEALGCAIDDFVPTTQLKRVLKSGQPNLFDLMQINNVWCAVTRLPIRNSEKEVIGAIGLIFYDELDHLQPMFDRFSLLRRKYESQIADRSTRYSLDDMLGDSEPMQKLRRQAVRAAQLDTTLLLLGETGTGKELLAQGVHNVSPRRSGPFVGINMGALPEALVESELFGAVGGAYTGADRKGRLGKIKLADGGTLFLDEIAEMPLAMQAKLLRVLQEREVEALGSNRLERVDVRVIAATAKDLGELVKKGEFREDLYYRLNVLPIKIPPLRHRKQDIPLLAHVMLQKIQQESNLPPLLLSASALNWLNHYHWPGNIRELRNRIERGCVMAEGEYIEGHDLDDEISFDDSSIENIPSQESELKDSQPLKRVRNQSELMLIQETIKQCGGNKTEAAKVLGISRAGLYKKLKDS